MDLERFQGFQEGFGKENTDFLLIPMQKNERHRFYETHLNEIREHSAVFAVSDYYAIDFIQFMQERSICIPEDISVAGFDDMPICEQVVPTLTSVHQDAGKRAKSALMLLQSLKQGKQFETEQKLPVTLIKRNSTANYTKN